MFQNEELDCFKNDPDELSNEVLRRYFNNKEPSFPIDPFDILNSLGVIYQFRNFEDLEGIYIVPENEDDIDIIGINNNRPIERQRFTAAHELCHYLKDKHNTICPIDGRKKSEIEKFADKFASSLLMPVKYLEREVKKYEKNGYISFDDILLVAEYFGVSFESCVFNIAYKLKKIKGNTDASVLKRRIGNYKPNKKRLEKGLSKVNKSLLINIINSYKYLFENNKDRVWYKFKNKFIYNENKIEGVKIEFEAICEIMADIRINEQNSEYCKSEYKDIIEVVGHEAVYEYIMQTDDTPTAFSLLGLHKILYKFAPYPDEGGKIRNSNNYVTEAKFETSDYKDIANRLLALNNRVSNLIKEKDIMSISEYIDEVVKIHHEITIIHPFHDGNGRISRSFLNWLFRINNLPPVYLKHKEKENYYEALREADINRNFDGLSVIFYKQVIGSIIELNNVI